MTAQGIWTGNWFGGTLSRTSFRLMQGIILLIAWANAHAAGLIVAAGAFFGLHVIAVRFNPRMAHRTCRGTGRHPGRILQWTHHRDQDCLGSGRVLRPGARYFGTPAVRAEAAAQQQARARAKANRAWR